jgi:hypothetical protein
MSQPTITTLFNIPAVRDYVSTFKARNTSDGSDANSVMDRAIHSLYQIYNEGPIVSDISEYAEKFEAKRLAIEEAWESEKVEEAKIEVMYRVCDPVAAILKARKKRTLFGGIP